MRGDRETSRSAVSNQAKGSPLDNTPVNERKALQGNDSTTYIVTSTNSSSEDFSRNDGAAGALPLSSSHAHHNMEDAEESWNSSGSSRTRRRQHTQREDVPQLFKPFTSDASFSNRRNTDPLPKLKPQSPVPAASQQLNGAAFRRSMSVGTGAVANGSSATANGSSRAPQHGPTQSPPPAGSSSTSTSKRLPPQRGGPSTPPPTVPSSTVTQAPPQALSAPRPYRPGGSRTPARTPQMKSPFYAKPMSTSPSRSPTQGKGLAMPNASGSWMGADPKRGSPGQSGLPGLSTSPGGVPLETASGASGSIQPLFPQTAVSLSLGAGSNSASMTPPHAGAPLPPLVPQGARSGIPRGLGPPPPAAAPSPPAPPVPPAGSKGAAGPSPTAPPSLSPVQTAVKSPAARPSEPARQPPRQHAFGPPAGMTSGSAPAAGSSRAPRPPANAAAAKPSMSPAVPPVERPVSAATTQPPTSRPSTAADDFEMVSVTDMLDPMTSLPVFTSHDDPLHAARSLHAGSEDDSLVTAEADRVRQDHSESLEQQRTQPHVSPQPPPEKKSPAVPPAPSKQQQQPPPPPPPKQQQQQQQQQQRDSVQPVSTGTSSSSSPTAGSGNAVGASIQHRPRQPSALASRSSVRPPPGAGAGAGSPLLKGGSSTQQNEAAALASYLGEEELNLSMSTFTTLGSQLSFSHALRVLNLRGSTIPSEGLRGLADIPTLQSICVSHMRRLNSLVPLITPSSQDVRCALQEIDAQCTPLRNGSIIGLEKLPRLRRLDLSMTAVTDVSCLSASHSLNELYLAATQVTSAGLRGLEKVPTLVTLNISRTKVTSLRALAASRSLQTLLLYSCKTTDSDIVGVAQMPRLATIDLSTTKVTDLSVFRDSPSLRSIKAQWLALKNCVDLIQDRRGKECDRSTDGIGASFSRDSEAGYSGLAAVPTLESIDLSFNAIRTVTSLANSTSLKHLVLRRTKIDSAGIAEIGRLARTLETLVITNLTDSMDESDGSESGSPGNSLAVGGPLCNVNVIAALTKLTHLDLSYTDVYDLRLLRTLPHLRELNIVETLVTVDGLRGLDEVSTLECLELSQTSVMSLQFLASGAKGLKRILVRSNRNVRGFRLGRIEGLPALESLDMSDTVVEDVRVMWTPAWGLKELIWRWGERREAAGLVPSLACWVTAERLTGIATMQQLARIDLSNSSVNTLSFLAGAPALRALILDGCRLLRDEHIRGIANERFTTERLEELDVANNPHLTDLTCLSVCRHLRTLSIMNDTALHADGIDGVWNLPTLKILNITNSGAEDGIALLQQQQQQQQAIPTVVRSRDSDLTTSPVPPPLSPSSMSSAPGRPPLSGRGAPGAGTAAAGDNSAAAPAAGDESSARSPSVAAAGKAKGPSTEARHGRHSEMPTMRDVSAVLDRSATPAQFRVPRRRRVSFVAPTEPTVAASDGTSSQA